MPFPNFFRAVVSAISILGTNENASTLLNSTAEVISNTSASIVHNVTKMALESLNSDSTISSENNNSDNAMGWIGIILILACVCCAANACSNSDAVNEHDICCSRQRAYII